MRENRNADDVAALVRARLEHSLTLSHLEIIDDSHKHTKHKNFSSDKKYFTLKITALEFIDKPLLECHKMIYSYLADLMKTSIHALSIKVIKE